MKNHFFIVFLLLIISYNSIEAIVPDPLVITPNDGLLNVGNVGLGCNAFYVRDSDNLFSQDTVLKFQRTSSAAVWEGAYWYQGGFNNWNGVSVGTTNTSTQYKYLVIKAKQETTQAFQIALKQIASDANVTTSDIISSNSAFANKWQNYYFELSGNNIPNIFYQLVIMPEQGNATCTDYINDIYFTNNELITQVPPTPTYSRTATTIDLVWTPFTGATSYKIVNAITGGTIKDNINGISTCITGLSPNTNYSFCLIAKDGIVESQMSNPVNVITRKEKGIDYEIIENFEGTINDGWINSGGCAVSFPIANAITNGINSSSNCAKVDISTSNVFYSGIQNNNERIDVGPNAPYHYLHIKMHRDQDDGKLGLTLVAREDINQEQLLIDLDYVSSMTDGVWHDYVFDLKNASTSDLSYFKFYIRTDFGNNTGEPNYYAITPTTTYIDDLILSNSDTIPECSSAILQTSFEGTNNQGVIINNSITPIAYSIINATGATVSGLPKGVNYTFNSGVLTISGTPVIAGTYNYLVTSLAACNTITSRIYVVNSNTDYFRSIKSGYWTDPTIWESSSDSINWQSATSFPSGSSKSVLIQNGDTVQKTLDLSLFENDSPYIIHVNSTGELSLDLQNQSGFNINGSIFNEGTVNFTGTSAKPLLAKNLINYGIINLSPDLNTGDLTLRGNFIQNGVFHPNNQAIQFTGNASQFISGAENVNFSYLRLLKSGGEVICTCNIKVTGSSVDLRYPAALQVSNTVFDVRNHTLQISDTNNISTVTCENNGVFRSNKNTKIIILGKEISSTVGNLDIEDGNVLGTLIFDRTNGNITSSSNFIISDTLFVKNGLLDFRNINIRLDSTSVGVLSSDITKNPVLNVKNLIFTKTERNCAEFYKNNRNLSILQRIRTRVKFDRLGKWHFISFPYSVESVKNTNESSMILGVDYNVAQYNSVKRASNISGWEYSSDTNLKALKGYIINKKNTLEDTYFDSYIHAADTSRMFDNSSSIYLTYTPAELDINAGWSFIAHPLSVLSTPNLIDGLFAYNYDETKDTYKLWYYQENPAYSYSSSGLQPMESYFVKLPSSNTNITYSMMHPLSVKSMSDNLVNSVIQFNLIVNNFDYQTYIRIHSNSTEQYDPLYDAPYSVPMYNQTPRIYTLIGTDMFTLNSVPNGAEVPIGIRVPNSGMYSFNWKIPAEVMNAYLIDKLTGVQTDMNQIQKYDFTSNLTGDINDRFAVSFVSKIVTKNVDSQTVYKIYSIDSKIVVEEIEEPSLIQLFDLYGRILQEKNVNGNRVEFDVQQKGIYFIKIITKQEQKIIKVITG